MSEVQLIQRINNLEKRLSLLETQEKSGNFTQGSVLFVNANGNAAQDNAQLFWDDTNNHLYIGGTSSIAMNGAAKVRLRGDNANAADGPHFATYTGADEYPLLQILSWTHDNVNISFDAYYDAGWKSSDAGSNYQIRKQADTFSIYYDSGVAQGDGITWNEGLRLGITGIVSALGNFRAFGDYTVSRGGSDYTGYIYVPLTTPLTSTSWDGDPRSDTAKTLIDLSAVFGVPAGVAAISVDVALRDSGSGGTDCRFWLGDDNTATSGQAFVPMPVNDRFNFYAGSIVACNANGDVYYQVDASGAGTMDVWIYITGYWI